MTEQRAIEILEDIPLMRVERDSKERSELGEALYMAIQALKKKPECNGCPCYTCYNAEDTCRKAIFKDDMK